jgi:formylmethanofuran dehydrogenase subunit B
LLDIHVYWNILTMHGPINVKSPNNISKWQMGFNSAFKGLKGNTSSKAVNTSVNTDHKNPTAL